MAVHGPAIVLRVTGVIDSAVVRQWEVDLDTATATVHRGGRVIVDLSEVRAIDSDAVATLVEADRKARSAHKELCVLASPDLLPSTLLPSIPVYTVVTASSDRPSRRR